MRVLEEGDLRRGDVVRLCQHRERVEPIAAFEFRGGSIRRDRGMVLPHFPMLGPVTGFVGSLSYARWCRLHCLFDGRPEHEARRIVAPVTRGSGIRRPAEGLAIAPLERTRARVLEDEHLMIRARQPTRERQRVGSVPLRREMLLCLAVSRDAANREVMGDRSHDDVALACGWARHRSRSSERMNANPQPESSVRARAALCNRAHRVAVGEGVLWALLATV